LLTAGPKRHTKFSKSSLDILNKILETRMQFSTQSNTVIPQIHQLFITVLYFSFTQCWPQLKMLFVIFSFDTCDVSNMKPATTMHMSPPPNSLRCYAVFT
jgi:hypothetical protein